ncbi:MAG: hypothetical protein SO063_00260 [Eubacteriales bacterium]|nr:hypothetical protein [Eubacteriales bacterium]
MVSHKERILLAMGDHQDGQTALPLEFQQKIPYFGVQITVEPGERFIQQQNPGLDRDRSQDRSQLLLAAGQLMRLAVHMLYKPKSPRQLLQPPFDLGTGNAARLQGKSRILKNRHMRKQIVSLGHQYGSSFFAWESQAAICRPGKCLRFAAAILP